MIPWRDPNKETPEIEFFVSKPLLYLVDGNILSGHYHMNGCYYRDSRSDNNDWLSRPSENSWYESISLGRTKAKICQWWAYLHEVPAPQEKTTMEIE